MARCKWPPFGWFCKLEPDHDGPCPAWPRLWNLRWVRYRFDWFN